MIRMPDWGERLKSRIFGKFPSGPGRSRQAIQHHCRIATCPDSRRISSKAGPTLRNGKRIGHTEATRLSDPVSL